MSLDPSLSATLISLYCSVSASFEAESPVSRAAVARPPNGGDADPDGRSVRARNDLPPRRQLTASPT
ncbi:hypothetical protein BRC64_03005 [Halobacteriales archaeon QH_10_67_22]|nr:MAG: hypothetical protein BRC64_03005 [Halobacteriales archaeon QH_10_67_22]